MDESKQRMDVALLASQVTNIMTTMNKLEQKIDRFFEQSIKRDEVDQRLTRIQNELDSRFTGAHARIDKKVDESIMRDFKIEITDRVKEIEDSHKWVIRLVIGAVITAAMALILK